MAIRGSNIGFTIMKIAAENSVESTKSNRAAVRAANKLAESAVDQQRAAEKKGHQMASAQATVGIIQAGVKTAMAAKNVGTEVGKVQDQMQFRQDFAQARQQGSSDQLMQTDMGNGIEVQDRFSQQKVDALLDGDASTEALTEAGFSPEEIESIQAQAGPDGELSDHEAADWMFGQRGASPEEQQAAQRDKWIDAGTKIFGTATEELTKSARRDAAEARKKAGEFKGRMNGIADEVANAELEHQRALGEAMLTFLRGGSETQKTQ